MVIWKPFIIFGSTASCSITYLEHFLTLASTVSSGDPESDPLFCWNYSSHPKKWQLPSNLGCGIFKQTQIHWSVNQLNTSTSLNPLEIFWRSLDPPPVFEQMTIHWLNHNFDSYIDPLCLLVKSVWLVVNNPKSTSSWQMNYAEYIK